MNLDHSISLLDDSLFVSKRGLIRPSAKEMEYSSNYGDIATAYLIKQRSDQLYENFLEILKSRTNDMEIFETLMEMIQTCSDMLDEMNDGSRGLSEKASGRDDIWLTNERNTWQLLYCLFKDRMINQKDEMDIEDLNMGSSEKQIVEQLYETNSNLREYQLIVDWLERCAMDNGSIKIGLYTDKTVGWENTLHQLKNCGETMFGSGREIVKSMDPDAAFREKLPLHDLDMADEARLSKQIFIAIRQGQFESAQTLCEHCGQPWRAALLEGWRLFHDPNYFVDSNQSDLKLPIEGNPRRDIWKRCAWKMADSKKLDSYTRAIAGALCGHLESLLNCSTDSWWDLLWSYLKVQIDIRVESEIRSTSNKSYHEMPEQYWNNKMSMEQIFDEIASNKNIEIQNSSNNPIQMIQKFLILDNIPELMRNVDGWLNDGKLLPQMLRFLSHLVLFMRQIGRQHQENIADRIIKCYVEHLIKLGEPQLVAFYTAALPRDLQTLMYSLFLETVTENVVRKKCLEEAISAGLDFLTITTYTVEKIRNSYHSEDEQMIESQEKISDFDEKKISSLEWLSFYPQQRSELLWQANAFIRNYLAERKINCVKKSFEHIPNGSIQRIISNFGSKEDIPFKEECSIKEYLSYHAYLTALDSYNDWVYLYHSKPKQPQLAKAGANFTEKVASEQKENLYHAELENWESNLRAQTDVTKELLYNILLVPDGGWLQDSDELQMKCDADEKSLWEHRLIQLENLRKIYIPEIVLLLHNVLHLAGEYKECMQLSDELLSEKRQIYKSFSKQKLREVLTKMAESSLALMNRKCDPWGYTL